ncbi:hypothetical protein SARC_12965 [Sphaeroforma arctica JP610]|uniref:Alpha-ketoglutarate-dependent dioxygenase FTO C-terminal domain-containing protein n=1 Tax=Sphaeroforma arctica JP610 TaxID=667725 RepID=A0A0L0FDC7_9EUKA|nr:hypothetical protein SARC_12965 [Sphaeroforma arctica JP610]KNC74491.1 hypothetical protein SARC_12965 [Sphaeroforma arctica JP610]|eukprot:XP_014148393.1 hypothetical protein SARC_12965 [Sphaeroforma arctica JP610]
MFAARQEFEWIRMFWLQGESHAQSHERYWLGCIQTLTHLWELSEAMLSHIVTVLGADVASEAGGARVCVSKDVRTYAMTIYILREIRFRRREYAKRCKSQAYHFLEARNKPVENKLKYNIPLDRAGLEAYKHLDLPQGVSLFSHTQACRKGARTCAFTLPKDLSPTIEAIEEQKKAIFGKV